MRIVRLTAAVILGAAVFAASLDALAQTRAGAATARRRAPNYSVTPDPRINQRFQLQFTRRHPEVERIYTDSRIAIHFFDPDASSLHAVFSDTTWARKVGGATGNATRRDVPDFIEDLAVALTRACDSLLAMRNASDPVFLPVLPLDVYVRDLGDDAGSARIGGPIYISNRRFEARLHGGGTLSAWEDMTHVAAHEMTHVLQTRYYAGGRVGNLWNAIAPGNRWFIEASANYYATAACRSRLPVKHQFFLKDGFDDYLTSSIMTNSGSSYYAVGALLEWLSSRYSPTLVGDAWAREGTSDLANLEAQLIAAGEPGGIGAALRDYAFWMLTHPEGVDSMNLRIKTEAMDLRMTEHLKNTNQEANFTRRSAFTRLERAMPPLSAQYWSMVTQNRTDALLVIDAGPASTRPMDLEWFTFDLIGSRDAQYRGKRPLESAINPPASRPIVIPHFGQGRATFSLEHLIVNRSMNQSHPVRTDFYILNPPDDLQVTNGSISWSTAGRLNIPSEIIRGYNVYADGRKLNAQPVPVAPDRQSFSHADLKATSRATVSVVDRHGNVWPEYAGIAPAEPTVRMGETIQLGACFSDPLNREPVIIEWRVVTPNGGRISRDGLYTAPTREGRFVVEARNRNHPALTASATITVKGAPPPLPPANAIDSSFRTMYIDLQVVTPTIQNVSYAQNSARNVIDGPGSGGSMNLYELWTPVERDGREFRCQRTFHETIMGRTPATRAITVTGRFNSSYTQIEELTVTTHRVGATAHSPEQGGLRERLQWNFTAAGIPLVQEERSPGWPIDDERRFYVYYGYPRHRPPAGFRFVRGAFSEITETLGSIVREEGFDPRKAPRVKIEIFFYRDGAVPNQ